MSDESKLRYLLWCAHSHPAAAKYGDDGEMQCNARGCMIDFKRDSADEIERKIMEVNVRRLSEEGMSEKLIDHEYDGTWYGRDTGHCLHGYCPPDGDPGCGQSRSRHRQAEKAQDEHHPDCDTLALGPELEPSTKPCNCTQVKPPVDDLVARKLDDFLTSLRSDFRFCAHGYIHITCGDCNAHNMPGGIR